VILAIATLFPVIQVEATTNQAEATNMTKGFGSSLLALALGQTCAADAFSRFVMLYV
jgi:hypothetical protein